MSEPLDYGPVLDDIGRKMGKPPRSQSLFHPSWKMRTPRWMTPQDELSQLFFAQGDLLRRAGLVWGVVLQANNLLFEDPGPHGAPGAPAAVILSTDERMRTHPHSLWPMVRPLYALKEQCYSGNPPQDPDARRFGEWLANEMSRPRGVPVPEALDQGIPALMTSIYFERSHLPHRKLQGAVIPLLYDPSISDMAMMAPCWFWPRDFLEQEWGWSR